MIDIVDALDLLDSCVRDRGANYRPFTAATDSIVTLALTKAGAPRGAIEPLVHTAVADLYAPGRPPLNLTLGAVAVLRAAHSVERRGETWAVSLQAAQRAASRFAELISGPLISGQLNSGQLN
jgi:hypothetical protein